MKYTVSVKLKAMLAPRIIDRPVRPRVQISGSMSRLDRTGVKLRRSVVFVLPPILGSVLLGGGSYFISPIVSPFFLAITRNSAPNVSPPLRLNFEIVSFLYALKFENMSFTPSSVPSVLAAIFSEIL
jgi:hypothetical protein